MTLGLDDDEGVADDRFCDSGGDSMSTGAGGWSSSSL